MIIVWYFDSQLQFNCQQIHRLHEISYHLDEQMYLQILLDEIGKIKINLLAKRSVSSISTDWLIQLMSIKFTCIIIKMVSPTLPSQSTTSYIKLLQTSTSWVHVVSLTNSLTSLRQYQHKNSPDWSPYIFLKN